MTATAAAVTAAVMRRLITYLPSGDATQPVTLEWGRYAEAFVYLPGITPFSHEPRT
jgi:hypothetical protein